MRVKKTRITKNPRKKKLTTRTFEVLVTRLPLCFEIEAESKEEALQKAYKENVADFIDEIANIKVTERYE